MAKAFNPVISEIFTLRRRVFAVVWLAWIVAIEVWPATAQGESNSPTAELVLATGSEQGLYFRIGQEISADLREHGINVRVVPSAGSVQNLELLASNQVQLCIAQADILRKQHTSDAIQSLVPLYTETVHVLIRNPVRVRRIIDLHGKRISVGPTGGGTARNAMAILEAVGIVQNDATITHEDFKATSLALQSGELDAAFLTMGCPSPLVESLMQNRCVSLFEPDRDILERLVNNSQGLVLSSIPAGAYANQDETIDTLGVPAVLTVRSDMDVALAARITRFIVERLPETLKQSGIKADNQDVLARISQIRVPVHLGAMSFYEEQQKQPIRRLKHWINVGGGPVILILMVLFVLKKAARIKRLFNRYPASRALMLLLSFWILGAIVMYYAERRLNDNYATLPVSFWSTFVNWISFGTKEPISIVGRVNSTIMALLGLGSISWLFGEVAAVFIKKRLNEANMCKSLNNHFVIINWNTMGPEVVKKIRDMQREIGSAGDVVIVSKSSHEAMRGFIHLDKDPLAEDLVKAANIQQARSVIILSLEKTSHENLDAHVTLQNSKICSSDNADTFNILIMMNLSKQLPIPREGDKYPHIVVEIQNPSKVHLLGAIQVPYEVVSAQAIASDLIIQVAGTPGLTKIYNELLTNGVNSNEIYRIQLSEKWHDQYFDELCSTAAKLRTNENNILPLAIMREEKTYVNPSRASIGKLREKDVLFAICDCQKDLERLNRP